ncbi:MAG: methylated-DNA--[protein]-cysteine S-methyltransferase [Bacteroidota bacterium]
METKETQAHIDFERVKEAIQYLHENFQRQPRLDEVSEEVNVSPHHFQRIFSTWAGTSPKKFLQYISLGHAKRLLREEQSSLFEAAYRTGLSGSSRLHDLFVNIEAMTPAEYKNGGEGLEISYSFAQSPFGEMIVASTERGLCRLAFADNRDHAISDLKVEFPNAKLTFGRDHHQIQALQIFHNDWNDLSRVKLHLRATPFQLRVWETLVKVPLGNLVTYGALAKEIGQPSAARAVGSAVGDNPIAFLIPCHRVIQSTGHFGNYHWGPDRKEAIIGWESARVAG